MNELQTELNRLLSQIPLFTAFSPEVAAELACRITERRLDTGQLLFSQGEMGEELMIVRRGSIKIFLPGTDNQDEAVIAILHDGEFFGELSLLDGQTRSASAVALCDTLLLSLQRDAFYLALQTDFQAVAHVISVLCQRLRATDVRLAESAFRDVRERLAAFLWNMAERDSEPTQEGVRLKTRFSDADIAQRVGAATERVQSELRRLERELVLSRHGEVIIILKPHDLRDMARGSSAAAAITVPEWLLG
jgi:CRP/FNR family cyclic AMP-dependent transcriptional regulator